jgi:hypothetical protein
MAKKGEEGARPPSNRLAACVGTISNGCAALLIARGAAALWGV